MNTDYLNVLFLPKWYPNKLDPFDGNFIENYSHAIKKYANVIVVFVHSDPLLKEAYEVVDRDNQGIREIRVYFKAAHSPFSFLNKIITALRYKKAQQIGYKLLSDYTINICHIHVLSRSSLLALKLKKKFNIPFIISEHWSGYQKSVGEYRGVIKKWFTNKVVKNASSIHTVSTLLKESMLAHGLKNKYHIIPNVVDTSIFKPINKNNDKTEIIFVGNLLQRPKRILDIINTFSSIVKEHPNIRLSIYGEGKDETKCKALIKELNLKQFVFLNGVRERNEIAERMAKSDFLILFSEFENQPCVINEAQSCGIPVVVPNIEGIQELMNGDLGICYPKNDIVAFREGIITMIKTHHTYKQETIRAYAVKQFSNEEVGKKFLELYKNTLAIG